MFILRKVVNFFNLDSERENPDLIHEEILKGIVFKGTNLWILVFAIVVASVGLNMNSTAVIIGAMLISPLMGPINGMGYSIATYDLELFRKSFKNFSFAVVASLIASTTYFSLSPVSTAHSELLARTTPTIYDVLIALFGGLAGIVAIISKQKGNVIPGVAIATALMPPLCTAGYGLATFQYNFFFGAFYLFTINTVFIALASVLISKILKFPIRTVVEATQKKIVNRWISIVISIIILPSIYLGYNLIEQEKFNENANRYIANISFYEGNYLLKSDIDLKNKIILLVYGGNQLTDIQKEEIIKKSENFKLTDAKVLIKQGLAFNNIEERNVEVFKLKEEINRLISKLKDKEARIDSLNRRDLLGKILLNEIKAIYPQVQGCSYSEASLFYDTLSVKNSFVILYLGKNNLTVVERIKINNWLKKRLNNETINVRYE